MKGKRLLKSTKILLAVLLIACLAVGIGKSLSKNVTKNGAEDLEKAVASCARQCYVVEGVYPESVEYLEEHYGLMINHNKYIVSYECDASNKMPQIMVLIKK